MKIIQVVAYYPPHIGGMENCVKEISDRLAKKGHHVEIFTSDIGCKKNRFSSTDNLKINYLKSLEFAHTAIIPSLFFRLLRIPSDSVIHVHTAQALLPEAVFVVSKIRKIPYIAHVHSDVEPSGKMGFLLPAYKKIFLQKILRSASRIVVPSSDYIGIISKRYGIPEAKIYKVPNGVDPEYFRGRSVKLHSPVRLLSVGRLSRQKNFPLLIQSYKLLVKKNKWDLKLHIVGDGEERCKILNLIKKENLEHMIILHGTLLGEDLHNIYSSSDIFISTTNYESFGLVLVEAMASGLPVVVSNIVAVKNIVKNNMTGLLVKQSPEGFSEAIGKLISDHNLRERLIKNGLREVRKYDWDKIVERFEDIYRESAYENNKRISTKNHEAGCRCQ